MPYELASIQANEETMPLKVYEILHTNSFPYEQAVAVRVAEPGDPITLDTDQDNKRMHRVYRRHPYQHISWGLVEGFDQFNYAPEVVGGRDGEIWVQVEYVIFGSHHRPDDQRIKRLRKNLKKKGLAAIPFPAEIRPQAHHIGAYNDAFHSLRLEGDLLRSPYHILFVSEISDVPVINDHTIPEDIDFAWVSAQVVTYRPYQTIPTYRELIATLDQYAGCFDGAID